MSEKNIVSTAIDLTLKIGLLLLVLFSCFRILLPFISMLLWGMIIAIVLYPLFSWLSRKLGGRRKLAMILITLLALAILIIPSFWLVESLVAGSKKLADSFRDGELLISLPPEKVASWPVIGNRLYVTWTSASENLGDVLQQYLPQIKLAGEKILHAVAGTGMGILQFAVSIIIAGIFLSYSKDASVSSKNLFTRLVGNRGEEFADITEKTIRNVATGIIGVAMIQSVLIGAGLLIINLPLAGVWTLLILVFAIAQLPIAIVTIPIIIYLFSSLDPLPAVLWTIYLLAVSLADNFLKPVLMGKGASVPMLVIFLGAIGGFMAFGFLGLFIGAILLSLGYKLYLTWLRD